MLINLASVRGAGQWMLDFLLPPICPVTREIVEENGLLHADAWQSLTQLTPPFCPQCGEPVGFIDAVETGNATLCADCLANPPAFQAARAALVYNDASRRLLLAFKHGDQQHLRKVFAPLLQRAGLEILAQDAVLVPVPLHRWRLWARRYNQSALLSLSLGELTGHAVMLDGLRRIRATKPQGHNDRKMRVKNVHGAFIVPTDAQSLIKDKIVILVDDVMTTGATLHECARALLDGGAAEVRCLAVARAVRHIS